MSTYKFTTRRHAEEIILQSNNKHWKIVVKPRNGHLYVSVYGNMRATGGRIVRRQGLSSVKADVSQFEKQASALYFYKLARDFGKHMRIQHVNYAEIFGSVWE